MNSANFLPTKTHLKSERNEYIIATVLGQGGFGIVYGAWDRQKNKVAIKEYFPSSFATRLRDTQSVTAKDNNQDTVAFFSKGVKRFYEEAQTMNRFNADANVVDVLDFFYANGTAYIVMEFIEGQTFMNVLKSMPESRLTIDDVLANISPAIDALERIHNTPWKDDEGNAHSGLIHRDISPDNIMFAGNGSLKLLDFGAARTVSMQGEFVLTGIVKPGYAPTEQFIGSGTAGAQGPWTDVYALAATIYRAITGKVPIGSLQRQAALQQQSKDPLVPPSQLGIPITSTQEAVLLKGMAMDYHDRYQTVRQFYLDLKTASIPQKSLLDKIKNGIKSIFATKPSATKSVNKFAWGLAVIAIIAAVFCYSTMTAAKRNYASVNQELSNQKDILSQYDYIKEQLGYGGETFYSDKPVIVMNSGGSTAKIPVYWVSAKSDDYARISCSDDISVKWGEFSNNKADVTVTSGNKKGYYPVHFKNDSTSEVFDVLVVVK